MSKQTCDSNFKSTIEIEEIILISTDSNLSMVYLVLDKRWGSRKNQLFVDYKISVKTTEARVLHSTIMMKKRAEA